MQGEGEGEGDFDGGKTFDPVRPEDDEFPDDEGADSDLQEELPREWDDGLAPQVTQNHLQEYLALNESMRGHCKTLPLTLAMWIFYCIAMFNHGRSRMGFESQRYIADAINRCSCPTCDSNDGEPLQLQDIKQWQQIMPWVTGGLVPMLQAEDQQQLVGYVRMEQTRGENTSTCANLNANFQTFYGSGCYPSGGTTGTYGPTKEIYELPEPAFSPVNGLANTYRLWLEVNRSAEVVSERLNMMARQGWVDIITQDIRIDGIYLNHESHLYTQWSVLFVMHREGLVETNVDLDTLRAETYTHWSMVFADMIWMALFCFLVYNAFQEVVNAKSNGMLKVHLNSPVMWIDTSLVLLGGVSAVATWYFMYWLNQFTGEVEQIGRMPKYSIAEAPDDMKIGSEVANRLYQDQLIVVFNWMDFFMTAQSRSRFVCFVYSIALIGRFMRGFAGQPRMAVLVQTFLYAGSFITHFMIVLCLVFTSFALGGYILFGEQVEGWSTMGSSISRMILVLFNRFNYEEFHNVAPVSAGIWYTSFFILAVLLLLRLLSAGILHHYMVVRERLGEPGLGIPTQIANAFRETWFWWTYEGAQKSIPYDELLRVLSLDTDPETLHAMGNLQTDRRMLTRHDLYREEKSSEVNEQFLMNKGCDPATAKRLHEACKEWTHSIAQTSSPARRLMVHMARHLKFIRRCADRLQMRLQRKCDASSKIVDRIDLKHAKNLSLARRIRRAQELPKGWSVHTDKNGRRFLRQDETGLTSWTLPKHLL